MVLSSTLLAQNVRRVDLSAEFTSPDSGSFYKLPNNVFVSIKVKNLGPDALYAGDTLEHQLSLGGFLNTLKYHVFNSTFSPGDSFILEDSISFWKELDTFSNGGLTSLRIFTFALNKTVDEGNGTLLRSYGDPNNNNPRLRLNWKSEFSNIEILNSSHLKAYPNPSQDKLNVSSDLSIKEIKIYSLSGQLMQSNSYKQGESNNRNITLSTNGLHGFYILSINYYNGSSITRKFQSN